MIRPLRQAHRRSMIALGLFLPTAFAVGITLRQPAPVAELPGVFAAPLPAFAPGAWQPGWFAKSGVQVRCWRAPENADRVALEFSAPKDFLKPDLLVYWAAGRSVPANVPTDTLPDNARLLGTFSAPTLSIPGELASQTGVLVLYSLADAAIVDVSKSIRVSDLSR